MTEPKFIPYRPPRLPLEETRRRAREFYEMLDGRRSVRMFSPDPVPRQVMEDLIRTASTAPRALTDSRGGSSSSVIPA